MVTWFKYRTGKRHRLEESLDRYEIESERQVFVVDSSVDHEEFKAALEGIDWERVFSEIPEEE